MPPGRSKPFSGKAKKAQLAEKRAEKKSGLATTAESGRKPAHVPLGSEPASGGGAAAAALPAGLTTSLGKSGVRNQFSTVFAREEDVVVEARRYASAAPVDARARSTPWVAPHLNDAYILPHPKGVLLHGAMVSGNRSVYLEADARVREEAAFADWLQLVYAGRTREQVNYFEHSLDVWQQLWHTLAGADVICIVADARNPLWHIPMSLFHQVTDELHKPVVIILNKVDLVPPAYADAWIAFLREHLAGKAKIVPFSSAGVSLASVTSLAQRRKLLRESKHNFMPDVVQRRAACVRDLLEATGATAEDVKQIVAKLCDTAVSATATSSRRRGADFTDVAPPAATGGRRAQRGAPSTDTNVTGAGSQLRTDVESDDNDSSEASSAEVCVSHLAEPVDDTLAGVDAHSTDSNEESDDSDEAAANDGAAESAGSDSEEEGDEEMRLFTLLSAKGAGRDTVAPMPAAYRAPTTATTRTAGTRAPSTFAAATGCGVDYVDAAPSEKSARRRARKLAKSTKAHEAGARARARAHTSADVHSRGSVRTAPADDGDAQRHARDVTVSGSGSTAVRAADSADVEAAEAEAAAAAAAAAATYPPRLVIGMVGHPNAGKSSVINCMCAEKRVSVSRTAGHTKRAQTVVLTPSLALLDCPGLVFPHALPNAAELLVAGRSSSAAADLAMQQLLGVIPIAQIREPFTAVRYLAEHLPLERMYGLVMPKDEDEWSPLVICEALAVKRGYHVAKVGRPDAHAAGREILYDAQDGAIPVAWQPPMTATAL